MNKDITLKNKFNSKKKTIYKYACYKFNMLYLNFIFFCVHNIVRNILVFVNILI